MDTQGAWVRKAGKLRYGYKKHHVTNSEGLVLGVLTRAAKVNEISNLEAVLDKAALPQEIPLEAAKGYQSKKNELILKKRKLKNRILKKARKHQGLPQWEKRFNKGFTQRRYKIERSFGSIKRWFNSVCARYRVIDKMHTQKLMEALC